MKQTTPMTVTVSNGEWRCQICNRQLGAVLDPFKGTWSAQIPDECETPQRCSIDVVMLAEATHRGGKNHS